MNLVPVVDAHDVPQTQSFDFVAGYFRNGDWVVPYFVSTMGAKEAADNLRLVGEMSGSESIEWSIDALFQRDVNWARVQGPLLDYLRTHARPQFFNSLTVVLLPFDEKNMEAAETFSTAADVDWKAPKIEVEDRGAHAVPVGPIKFAFYSEWEKITDDGFRLGKMKWNTEQVQAVALDGQHRLAAIKERVQEGKMTSRVPVIFIILDERIGYQRADSSGGMPDVAEDHTQTMRSLFIDLNKHAKTVNRARVILLDDADPLSQCIRSVISDRLQGNIDSLSEEPSPTLPLSLVDWHSEQPKFERGPFVTSILNLDWIVGKLLEYKEFDPYDSDDVRESIESLQNRLRVDLQSALQRSPAKKSLQTPFAFNAQEIQAIKEGFRQQWGGAITTLLTQFSPYRDLIGLRTSQDSLSLEWQWWFKLHEDRQASQSNVPKLDYDAFVQRHSEGESAFSEEDFLDQLKAINNKKRDSNGSSGSGNPRPNLAFTVVFQKSFFLGFRRYAKVRPVYMSEIEAWLQGASIDGEEAEGSLITNAAAWAPTSDQQMEDVKAREWTRVLNKVFDSERLLSIDHKYAASESGSSYFWMGSLRSATGDIDYAEKAAKRTGELLYLFFLLGLIHEAQDGNELDFSDLWEAMIQSENGVLPKSLTSLVKRSFQGEDSIGGRILSANEKVHDPVQSERVVRERIEHLWDSLSS